MLGFLFPRLTPAPERGEAHVQLVTAKARERHWYLEGRVPDTIDGRFRMMATLAALVIVRLEQAGEEGEAASVALTERFIEVMESEHRELGLGDPKLGRTVRKLVGSLARRVEVWRSAVGNAGQWQAAARESVYRRDVDPDALGHTAGWLREFWSGLQGVDVKAIAAGEIAVTDTFAHELRLDQIRDGERIDLIADDSERRAIAKRFDLDTLDRLEAHAVCSRDGDIIRVKGRLARIAGAKLRRHQRADRQPRRRTVRPDVHA